MMEAALAAYTTECQAELSKDPANYVTDLKGDSVLKPELFDDVCSVFCLRNGHCDRGKCVCNHGYTGENCQLLAGKGPQLSKIRSNQTCDVSKRPCRKIFIDATNLENVDTLACKVGSHVTEAEFIGAGRLACHLPNVHGQATTSLTVAATNDGQLYGNELHLTVFDGTCQSCDQQGHCTILPQTCRINNKCYQDLDSNPADASQACDSNASNSKWTTKPTSSGHYPKVVDVVLSGPNSDQMFVCGVETSSTDSRARFRVTWYIENEATASEVLTAGDLEAYLPVKDLPRAGKLSCEVQSFFAGETVVSPWTNSGQRFSLAVRP